jgi:phage tail protein X
LPLVDLAKQYSIPYGALRARASREKWSDSVTRINERVTQSVTERIADQAHGWIAKIDKFVHAGLDKLNLADLDLDDLAKAVGIADTVDKMARRAYGLDAQAQRTTINVAVDARPNTLGAGYTGQVVDIASTPVLSEPSTPPASDKQPPA